MAARDSEYRFAGWVFAGFSGVCALGALAIAGWSLSQSFGSERVAATVVAVDQHVEYPDLDSEPSTMYTPIAEYEANGRVYRCRGSGVPRASWTHQVGDRVDVLYKVHQPATGYIDSFVDRWLAPLVVMAMSALVAAPACFLLRKKRRPA